MVLQVKASLLLVAVCLACSGPRIRRFPLTSAGFRTEGADWVLDPVDDGKMMPRGWERQESKVYDEPTYVFVRFKRTDLDGDTYFSSWKLAGDDQRKQLRALAERALTQFRLDAGNLLFATAEPARSILVDGAEAQEGVYELRRRDDYAPIARVYAAFAKSLTQDAFAAVFYTSPPGQFDEGLEAARSLMRRLHFPPAPEYDRAR